MTFVSIFFVLGIAFWFAPALLGLLDFSCWFVIAEQCSKIDWYGANHLRMIVAAAWTLIFPLVAMIIIAIFNP